jgi:hypothetical protein
LGPIREKRSKDGSRASRTSQSTIPRQPGRGRATNWNPVPTSAEKPTGRAAPPG